MPSSPVTFAARSGQTLVRLVGGAATRSTVAVTRTVWRATRRSGEVALHIASLTGAHPLAALSLMVALVVTGGAGGVALHTTTASAETVSFAAEMPALRLVGDEDVAASVAAIRAARAGEAAKAAAAAKAQAAPSTATTAAPRATRVRAAVRPAPAVTVAPNGHLTVWPARGRLTGAYGEQRRGHRHPGIDIDGDTGDPIRAPGDGVVVAVGYQRDMSGYGQVVIIDHGNGLRSMSAHLSSMSVSPGQRVTAGTVVGTMGTTGNVTGSHLHFEVFLNGARVNPMSYLPGR